MNLNRAAPVFVFLLLVISLRGYSQQLETGINIYPGLAHSLGVDPGMNGSSLNLDYLHKVGALTFLKGGLELGYTGWGSQGLIATGLRYGGINAFEAEILNGIAFYQQGPNYVFGTGAYYSRSFFTDGKNRLLLSLGIRYTLQPAYKEFSPIYYYIDFPLRIRWVRKISE